MKKEDSVGYQLRTAANLVHRYLDFSLAEKNIEDLTGIQAWVIHYLVNTSRKDVFQKHIEEDLSMQRSTASHVLTRMERNGYIQRKTVSFDRRLKKVVPTEKLYSVSVLIADELRNAEKIMKTDISSKEEEQFFTTVSKIKENLQLALEESTTQSVKTKEDSF